MGIAKPYFVVEGYKFVAYPNRNSLLFKEYYGIPEADTVIRGSLRYEGNPAFVEALIDLGWLDTTAKDWLKEGLTWAEIFRRAIGADNSSERYVRECNKTNLYQPLKYRTQRFNLARRKYLPISNQSRERPHSRWPPIDRFILLRASHYKRQ